MTFRLIVKVSGEEHNVTYMARFYGVFQSTYQGKSQPVAVVENLGNGQLDSVRVCCVDFITSCDSRKFICPACGLGLDLSSMTPAEFMEHMEGCELTDDRDKWGELV